MADAHELTFYYLILASICVHCTAAEDATLFIFATSRHKPHNVLVKVFKNNVAIKVVKDNNDTSPKDPKNQFEVTPLSPLTFLYEQSEAGNKTFILKVDAEDKNICAIITVQVLSLCVLHSKPIF